VEELHRLAEERPRIVGEPPKTSAKPRVRSAFARRRWSPTVRNSSTAAASSRRAVGRSPCIWAIVPSRPCRPFLHRVIIGEGAIEHPLGVGRRLGEPPLLELGAGPHQQQLALGRRIGAVEIEGPAGVADGLFVTSRLDGRRRRSSSAVTAAR
jgi:hypothetical protein